MTTFPLQDSASWHSEVMSEQTTRLQELRRRLSPGSRSRSDSGLDSAVELQAVTEELRLVLRREKDTHELSCSRAVQLESLTRTLLVKDELIRVSVRGAGGGPVHLIPNIHC